MLRNQKVLQNQVDRYQTVIGATTSSLGWLGDMAIKAGEALGLLAGEKNPKPPSAPATSRGVPTSGSAMGETKGGTAGAGAAPASSMGVPPPGAGVARPEQAPQLAAIRDLIGKVESYGGDYNVAVGGAKYNLTDMTIKEVMDLQRKLIGAGQGSAMGKYQVIATTLSEAVAKLGISRDEKFDQATQDRIGDYLIMKRGYAQYANNPTKEAKERFLTNLAAEWAGLPAGPDGRSRYAGVGNNKAGIGWNEALEKFADGGTLGAGKMGIAGEAGAELITGPADITPMNDLMTAVRDLIGVTQMSLSALESINRNTSNAADVGDRMLRLAQN